MNKINYICLLFIISLLGCKTQPTIDNISNFGIIDNNRNILRGGQPTKDGFDSLKRKHIKKIIALNSSNKDDYAKNIGIEVIYIPITTGEQIFGYNLDYKIPLAASYITNDTYIHCTYGKNRTGEVVGYYLIKFDNYSKYNALKEMDFYGWGDSLPGLKWYFNNTFKK